MSGIYIHIPFCKRRCSYCDFFFTTNTKLTDDFLRSLSTEIKLHSASVSELTFDTISFGGGTPSLLSGDIISELITILKDNFQISDNTEISLEANPEDLTGSKLREIQRSGINRLSIGVQSFIDSELEFLTRHHSSNEAQDVVKNALDLIDNVSIDIIYSLPSQRYEDIAFSILKANELGIKHVSAYTLTFEEKTLLTKHESDGKFRRNSPEHEAMLYETVARELNALDFIQYEVSNFAKHGFESRHNKKYWELKNYLGFGPSSHSFIDNKRWNNVKNLGLYSEMLKKNELPVENPYELTNEELKSDFVMLALRAGGVFFEEYERRFEDSFLSAHKSVIDDLVRNGFAEVSQGKFCLTSKGYAIADEIIARYF